MPELNWKHHTLIQSLLSRGPLTSIEFHKVFEGITGRNPGMYENMFNDYLLKINQELAFAQIELRACRNQYDGKIYYGVVNNVADDHSKLGTKYSVPQIAFYKGIIEAIVQDAAGLGFITNIGALHVKLDNQVPSSSQPQPGSQSQDIPAAIRNFSLSQKEKTLEELVRDGWLSNIDGFIGFGVRSFLDLRSWFRNNEIPACEVCNEAGVKAESCPNENCTVRIHKYCLIKKFSQKKAQKVCPGCKEAWPYVIAKGEVVEDEDDSNVQTEQHPPRKRGRSSQASTQDSDAASSSAAKLRRSSRFR
ncbi:hypothetical protein KSS87_005979 [Heliosperma pusillum]|nr:hypothetical protein KSS87_005979 [Heliosperma pusillum]